MDEITLDTSQAPKRLALGSNECRLVGREASASRNEKSFVVEAEQKVSDRIGRRQLLLLEESQKAGVGSEHGDVVHTLTPGRKQEHDRLEVLDLVEATAPLSNVKVAADRFE
jgi:hypothetical protein